MDFRLIFHFGAVLFSGILALLGLFLFIISLTKWKKDKNNKYYISNIWNALYSF